MDSFIPLPLDPIGVKRELYNIGDKPPVNDPPMIFFDFSSLLQDMVEIFQCSGFYCGLVSSVRFGILLGIPIWLYIYMIYTKESRTLSETR